MRNSNESHGFSRLLSAIFQICSYVRVNAGILIVDMNIFEYDNISFCLEVFIAQILEANSNTSAYLSI